MREIAARAPRYPSAEAAPDTVDTPGQGTPALPHSPSRVVFPDDLRALGIVQVVAIHALGYATIPAASDAWMRFLVQMTGVPLFLVVDGYLFATAEGSGTPVAFGRSLARSARRLLRPWILFSLLYLAIRAAFEAVQFFDSRLVLGQSPIALLRLTYTSGVAYQLYFLPALFLIRALAPGVRHVMAGGLPAVLVAFVASAVLFRSFEEMLRSLMPDGLDPVLHALWGIQFWLLGVLFHAGDAPIRRHAGAVGFTALALAVGLFVQVDAGPFTTAIIQFLLLLGAYGVVMCFSRTESVITRIGRQTMGIYLLHAPVLIKASALVVHRLVADPHGAFLLTLALTFTAALAATQLLQRTRFGPFLFGEPIPR